MAARGGRGGGRGGRGGRRGPGGLEAENKFQVSYDPKPTYPEMKQPPPLIDADDWEADCVANMIEINRRRKEMPLYVPTVAGNVRVDKSRATTSTAKFDPFTGPTTYSQKYHKVTRTAPDFSGREWFAPFLPPELRHTVDPSIQKPSWMDEEKKNAGTAAAKKSTKTANINLLGENEEEDEEEDADKELEPEEQDENWEEDEDEDMDYEKGEKDDYNAEQYFDNGEDDGGDFGGDEGGEF